MSVDQRMSRLSAIAVAAGVLLAGCAGNDDEAASPGGPDSVEDPLAATPEALVAEDDPEAAEATELRRAVNEAMSGTTFYASGGSSALPEAEQQIWSDPAVGVRVEITAPSLDGGEMYCQDGVLYSSMPLFVAQLAENGEELDVPEDLAGHFISRPVGSDCGLLYEIQPGASLDPDADDSVDGAATTALVQETPGMRETYQVASEGEPYMLRLDSEVNGLNTSLLYTGFGAPVQIEMPPEDRRIAMEEVRSLVQGG